YGSNTRDDAIWAVRKYLFYFQQQGHESISDVTVEDARQFLLRVATEVKLSTLHTLLLYVKYFHMFLREQSIPAPDCVDLFDYTIYREMPIQSYVTDAELEAVLNVIDRETDNGKRNYAIIMVAAATGMRACDIIQIKLSDIDWRKGEIRVVQKKTGRFVSFPLTREVGDALKDYILNARPASESPEVFLRLRAPHAAMMDAVAVGDMFGKYQKKAGIVRQPFDGKGFHGLRRRLAKKLIVNGTPLTTVAQILGHNDLQSVRQYLSLDTENLRECALDFSRIPVKGGLGI
ncbi:MAG: tyrosine-type recombinase/integrase, partial [Clostridia bacterium]|nr:tyrosine-type recombinase/integrase [Clostridia bacterium]